MNEKDIEALQTIKRELGLYHGSTKLKNIPQVVTPALYHNLSAHFSLSLDQTISEVVSKINNTLSVESIALQFVAFQKAIADNKITR